MNAENFAYWLNGYFELAKYETLDSKQVQIIKDHLALVFNKVTPVRQDYCSSKDLDTAMNYIGDGPMSQIKRGHFLTKEFTGTPSAGC